MSSTSSADGLTQRMSADAADAAAAAFDGAEPSVERGAEVGRYIIVDHVGAGGMGEVFSAYDPELDRRVAIKLVRVNARRRTDDAKGRLLREAQALAKLSHPNVVAVHDAGTHGERVFIAMEFVDGQTLDAWLEAGPRSVADVLDVMLRAGRGLAAAHASGMVHRDFKPANVMVSKDVERGSYRVRVLDFGLARVFGDTASGEALPPDLSDSLSGELSAPSIPLSTRLTETGIVMGTPAYMAPEQFRGAHVDARTDQFAFCVVLYRALFRQRPFDGDTYEELSHAVRRGRVVDPPRNVRVPRGVKTLLRRGLDPDPGARYRSMEALLADLERAGRSRRRSLGLFAAGALVVVGAIAIIGARPRPCEGAEERLAGAWDGERKEAVAAAFRATQLPYAEAAWLGAEAALDSYTAEWIAIRTDACEATRVRGDQSEELMDLRMRCLDERLRHVAALTDLLVEADAEVVQNATQAATDLPSLRPCADTEQLVGGWRPATDTATAHEAESMQPEIARARALLLSGKVRPAIEAATPLLEQARSLGHDPSIAEVALILAGARMAIPEPKAALATYEAAMVAAARAAMAENEVDAIVGVSSILARHFGQTDIALRHLDHAEAIAHRLGDPPELVASILVHRANAHFVAHDVPKARAAYEEVLEVTSSAPSLGRFRSMALNNLAAVDGSVGRHHEALGRFTESLALTERMVGALHPSAANHHMNIGVTLAQLDRLDEAESHQRRAIEIWRATLGHDSPELARAYHNLAVVLGKRDELEAAREFYDLALAIKRKALGDRHESTGQTANNLGDVLIRLGQPRKAIPLAQSALDTWEHVLGPEHPNMLYGLTSLMEAYLALDEPQAAIIHAQRAAAIATKIEEWDPLVLARARFFAAKVLWHSEADRDHALDLARTARDDYARAENAPAEDIEAVEAWLRRRAEPSAPTP